MIKSFISELKAYAKNNKKIAIIICVVWLILTLLIGVIIGINGRDGIVTLSPEEENNRALKIIKSDNEKIEQGLILTPAKNLSTTQIELAKDYAGKIKASR